jgi:hypothetical protein
MEKVGIYSFGICGSIVVYDIDDHGDAVVYRYESGERKSRLCRAKVRYTADRAYFRTRAGRIYLDEVMRTN